MERVRGVRGPIAPGWPAPNGSLRLAKVILRHCSILIHPSSFILSDAEEVLLSTEVDASLLEGRAGDALFAQGGFRDQLHVLFLPARLEDPALAFVADQVNAARRPAGGGGETGPVEVLLPQQLA